MELTRPPTSSTPGTLHYIPPNVCLFEPTKPGLQELSNTNTLIWIGGMFDTLGSVAYPYKLALALPPSWTLACCSLGSAGLSWGVTSISADADDLAKIVTRLRTRRPHGKILLMGHSTGCQDCMEYLVGDGAAERPSIDGIILQAPVSDREAIAFLAPPGVQDEADRLALAMVQDGREKDALPHRLTSQMFGPIAISATRWLAVSSPGPAHEGADDYFSSDLPLERLEGTFGRLPASSPLLVLISGADENQPADMDKEALARKWTEVVKRGGGRVDEVHGSVVPGATHDYNGSESEVVQDLTRRVVGFIERIERKEFDG